MFGLENKKNNQTAEFVFELEKELKHSTTRQEYKKRIEDRIQKIKEILRSGENKEEFDQFGVILHGYTSLLKVMARLTPK